MRRIRDVRKEFRDRSRQYGLNPRDVDLLIGDVLGQSFPWLVAHDDEAMPEIACEQFLAAWKRRRSGEPIQYIRGFCEFYGRDFAVDSRVLIPRPETEILVETAIRRIPREARVVDVGTGSGCIAITLDLERPDLSITAIDISLGALQVARLNQRRLQSRVHFLNGDRTTALRSAPDVVVSNPPYIASDEVTRLQKEVRDYEPVAALSPGADALSMIRELITCEKGESEKPALVILEIGFDQKDAVEQIARSAGWRSIEFVNDLAAIPRVAVLSP